VTEEQSRTMRIAILTQTQGINLGGFPKKNLKIRKYIEHELPIIIAD
jgi:hypothetical protein